MKTVGPLSCRFSTSPTLVLVSPSPNQRCDLLGVPTLPVPLQNPYLGSIKTPQTMPPPLLSPKPFFSNPHHLSSGTPPGFRYFFSRCDVVAQNKMYGLVKRQSKDPSNLQPPTFLPHPPLPKGFPLKQSEEEIITSKPLLLIDLLLFVLILDSKIVSHLREKV